jgi:hypothetical protein
MAIGQSAQTLQLLAYVYNSSHVRLLHKLTSLSSLPKASRNLVLTGLGTSYTLLWEGWMSIEADFMSRIYLDIAAN